jgi:hypothetical protein
MVAALILGIFTAFYFVLVLLLAGSLLNAVLPRPKGSQVSNPQKPASFLFPSHT